MPFKMETPKNLITPKKTEKPLNTGDTGESASVLGQYLSPEDREKINKETLKQKTTEGEENPEDPESESGRDAEVQNAMEINRRRKERDKLYWDQLRNFADKTVGAAVIRIQEDPKLIKDPTTIKEINKLLPDSEDGTLPKEIALEIANDNPEFFFTMIMNEEKVKGLTSSEVVDMIIDKRPDLLSKYIEGNGSPAHLDGLTIETKKKIFESGEITRDAQHLIMLNNAANEGYMATALLENSKKDPYNFEKVARLIVKNFNNFNGLDKKAVWEQLKAPNKDELNKLADEVVRMSL